MIAYRWLTVALLALAVVAGAGFALQRQSADALQQEIALLREENHRLARLRAENQWLAADQVPESEVERLRADHAALTRLRAEIEEMKARAKMRSR